MNQRAVQISMGLLVATMIGFAAGRFTMPQAAWAQDAAPTKAEAKAPKTWPVVKVEDGDMFDIKYIPPAPMEMRLRLLNIDTPNKNDKASHKAAREALAAMVYGKQVRVEFEKPGVVDATRGGQLLTYVFVGDKCVNVELVRQGISKFITKYGEGRMAEAFKAAEAEAQTAKRGVWAE